MLLGLGDCLRHVHGRERLRGLPTVVFGTLGGALQHRVHADGRHQPQERRDREESAVPGPAPAAITHHVFTPTKPDAEIAANSRRRLNTNAAIATHIPPIGQFA